MMRMRAVTGDAKKLRKAYEKGGQIASEAVAQITTVAILGREVGLQCFFDFE